LVAGQQTVLAARAGSSAVAPAETRWVTGMLALDATPLGEAVAAINRYNGVQIRLADPALAVLRVTGAFHVHDPGGFAGAVAATFGLTVTRDGDAIVMTPRARSVAAEGVLPVAMA
jgi:transmembrane sensor